MPPALPDKLNGPLGHLFLNLHYKHTVEHSGGYAVDLFDVGIFVAGMCSTDLV